MRGGDRLSEPSSGLWDLRAPGIFGEDVPMRDWSGDEVDFCIVGAGSGGGVLGAKLAEAGFRVVILDAGPHWNPVKDFVSDEVGANKLYWTEERITGGENPIALGSNNSGQGVGGSTVHYSMVKLRMHPKDFRMQSLQGPIAGAEIRDWPLGYEDLEPYYEEIEEALQVAGPTFYPWGRRRKRYPQREHEMNAIANMMIRGGSKLGIKMAAAPISTLSAPHGNRPPCVYRGFCNYGCSTNAKSSILVTFIPRAISAGAEVRANCMVGRIEHDRAGRATGVVYFNKVKGEWRRQKAHFVAVAGYAVETPRLLLMSASSLFPDGLANSSGLVGKCFMVHSSHQVFARFEERMNVYKAPPAMALTEDFNRPIPEADLRAGYTIETVGPHILDFSSRMATARQMWGMELRERMVDYNYYAGMGIVGEMLPQMRNQVRLHESVTDPYGLPVAEVQFSQHEHDKRLIQHALQTMKQIWEAVDGEDQWQTDRHAHLMGGCRMGEDPSDSVVDRDCRTHDIPNLFICDSSVFPTSSAVNPSLTIQANAARVADRIKDMARRGELRLRGRTHVGTT